MKTNSFPWRRLLWFTVFSGTGLTVSLIFLRFHPSGLVELTPAAGRHRVIAARESGEDAAFSVLACDWPHTFFSPFRLGGAEHTAGFPPDKFFWSGDGTLIVCETTNVGDMTRFYTAAYDFKDHAAIDNELSRGEMRNRYDRSACHKQIAYLLARRGGIPPVSLPIFVPLVKAWPDRPMVMDRDSLSPPPPHPL